MQLADVSDGLTWVLSAGYLLVSALLILGALGVIGSASKEGRIAAGFIAGILLPAGLSFILTGPLFSFVSLLLRILSTWGLVIWWISSRSRESHD